MAWAKHAAGCGLTQQQIIDELLNGRDLSKKGDRKRQVDYALRVRSQAEQCANCENGWRKGGLVKTYKKTPRRPAQCTTAPARTYTPCCGAVPEIWMIGDSLVV